MEQFAPSINISGISDGDVLVTFDSAAGYDAARSPRTVRISAKFAQLSLVVEGFNDDSLSSVGSQKEYKGKIKLRVVGTGEDESSAKDLVLAEPQLWLSGKKTGSKGGPAYTFPASDDVKLLVQQGVASALADALAVYLHTENQVHTFGRNALAGLVDDDARPMVGKPAAVLSRVLHASRPAGRSQAGGSGWKRNAILGVASFVGVALFCVFVLGVPAQGVKAASTDAAVQTAVAQNFAQNPAAMQAQVELTKETLKQMGLDPGKSGDVGCLAPQQ